MKVISFIITNYNTKKYTEFVYNSIRKNLGYVHEIVMLDDGSEDGTWELLQRLKQKDHNLVIHKNEQNEGIAYSYNKMVELSSNEVICMLHSDMYVPPNFDKVMLKYMNWPASYDFITPLRVEPDVGYPGSVDKLLINFGTKSEDFDEGKFIKWHEENMKKNENKTEQRMFFPWMITKTFYNKVGGNDLLFSKYMVDDDDFYLRLKMAGAKYCQLFETAVYHMPSKSVRMREDNQIDINPQYEKSLRNFIRKWGTFPAQVWDDNRDMIIPKKYDIGIIAHNVSSLEMVRLLEPWCTNLYIKDRRIIMDYSRDEQVKTLIPLHEKIRHLDRLHKDDNYDNDIIVEFDASSLDQKGMAFLQMLPQVISDSGKNQSDMKYEYFRVRIKSLKTYEKELIKCKR
tara:strand:+ start:2366 stop:3562 length:1197 start_codon:yes stop_codon:yes gene_type:complete